MDAHETDGLLLRSQQMDDFDEQPADDHLASNMFSRMKHGVAKSWRSSRPKAALLEEYRHVKDALVDVMQETEDEADFFLSMGLTKNLSILPSKPEVVQSVEEVKDLLGSMASSLRRNLSLLPASSMRTSDHKPAQQPQQSQTVPLHAYLTLASAVCALSSIGPFLAKQQDVSANLKVKHTYYYLRARRSITPNPYLFSRVLQICFKDCLALSRHGHSLIAPGHPQYCS
jgi:hypothetical protein